jgi:hypothetical protein
MSGETEIVVTPWRQSEGTCDCCGRTTKTVWGDLGIENKTVAIYYVSWTRGARDHPANIDLIIGPWEEESNPSQRVLVSLLYKFEPNGGSFMVIDSEQRLHKKREICGRGMRRVEVVGTALADQIFEYVDAIWLSDPRVSEVHAQN